MSMSSSRAPAGGFFFDEPLASIIHAAREAIVMIDAGQTIVAVNPAAEALLEAQAHSLLGQSLARFVPARWRMAHAAQVRAFADSGTRERAMAEGRVVRLLTATGREVPVEIALSRVTTTMRDGGAGTHFAALLREQHDAQSLRDQLDALRTRLRAVLELAPIAIWIVEDELVVFANRAAQVLFGTAHDRGLVGEPVYALLDEVSRPALRQGVAAVLSGQWGATALPACLLRGDGARRDVEIALAALPDHGQTTVQMVVADVTERRREALELARSREATRRLSASVVEAREEERRRIARELHDELGQRLTALKLDLTHLACREGRPTEVDGMLALLDETVASVRRIATDLRPLMLDDLGLNAAIEWLARDASQRLGIPIEARLPLTEPPLSTRASIALYRMVQEALTNVARHSHATKVQVRLDAAAEGLTLTVQDDGVGFGEDALHAAGGFGLLGLRERAEMLGGELVIGSAPDGGGLITVRLPLAGNRAEG
jgi:two-component system, NarL family, sensor histidine kinase UhpB